jgi:putative hydrolase of the HAD superfamily
LRGPRVAAIFRAMTTPDTNAPNQAETAPQARPGEASGFEHIDTWIFDLDNTLYPASCRLFDQVERLIGAYVARHLKVDAAEAYRLQKLYFREYGTTMNGLMLRHGVDPHDFLDFVHEIDLSPVLPSPALAAALAGLPGRKLIYTNGSVAHAERVMDRLGVREHFSDVFDIVAGNFVPKPQAPSYRALIERHGIEPRRAALFEDLPQNLEPAAAMGMVTVLVRTDSPWAQAGSDGDHIHHVTDDLAGWLAGMLERLPPR